jgi:hypothetical protein
MPTFPEAAMLGSLGDLARELGRGNEVPDEFLFANALTVAGTIMSGRFLLDIGLESDTRLYTVTVGDSADTKKSTAQRKVTQFFISLNIPGWSMCHGVGSAEGLAKAHDDCSRVALVVDELKTLLQKTHIRGSVLLPMLATLYEQTYYQNETQHTSINLSDARLTLMANSTLDTYESLWDHEALAIGLVNRLFLVTNPGKPRVAWPRNPTKSTLAAIANRIKLQLSTPPPEPYRITLDAQKLWADWYNDLPKSEFTKRLDGLGFRLMPILTATTDKAEVDAEIVTAVTAILDYELNIRKSLQPIDADNAVAKMEQKIVRVLDIHGPLSRRDLSKYCNAHRTGEWIFKTALENMMNVKVVAFDARSGRYHLADQAVDMLPKAVKQVVQ